MTTAPDLGARYMPHPEVIESRLGEETVMLHLGSAVYFGLDEIGTVVWERLQQGHSPAQIAAHLRSLFPDAPASVEDDVTSLITHLLEKNLITVS